MKKGWPSNSETTRNRASRRSQLNTRVTEYIFEIKRLKELVFTAQADKSQLEKDIYKLHVRIARLEKMVEFREELIN